MKLQSKRTTAGGTAFTTRPHKFEPLNLPLSTNTYRLGRPPGTNDGAGDDDNDDTSVRSLENRTEFRAYPFRLVSSQTCRKAKEDTRSIIRFWKLGDLYEETNFFGGCSLVCRKASLRLVGDTVAQ